MTLKHGIQRFFWLTELNKVNRDLETNITTFYLKDGNTFSGEWVSNTDWETLYFKERNILEKGYIYGLSQSEERYKKINIGSVASIEFDNSKAKEMFDRRHREYFKKNSPKEIVLNDNSKIISDISYIIDFCGHYYSTDCHIRLMDDLELLKVISNLEAQEIKKGEKGEITYFGDGYFEFTENTRRNEILRLQRLIPVEAAYNYKPHEIKEYLHQIQIPLDEILDLEFTGGYYKLVKREENDNFYGSTVDNDYREIIINNRLGRKERAFLYSTSESHFGHCGESLMNRTHDMDSVIVMQKYGAIAIPLNLIKKIIFLDNKKGD